MGRRERNRALARETMITVAHRLFREQGYDETTVDEIAKRAQVSPRTFYRYFTSKDNILAVHGTAITDEVLVRVPPHSSVHELLEQYALVMEEATAEDHFRMLATLLRETSRLADHVPVWRQAWEDRLAQGLAVKEGREHPDLECRVRSAMAMRLIAIAIDRWLYEQSNAGLVAITREVADVGRRQFIGHG